MKHTIALLAVAGMLLAAAPAEAAGCLKGAIVGGIAAKATHHSLLLGAIGGCIVGHVLSHPSSSITYSDVTGKLLGSDADLAKVAAASTVNIVKLSTLKGFKAGDTQTQALIASNAGVKHLDGEVAANAVLTSTLTTSGFAPTDVIAVSAALIGGDTLYVNK